MFIRSYSASLPWSLQVILIVARDKNQDASSHLVYCTFFRFFLLPPFSHLHSCTVPTSISSPLDHIQPLHHPTDHSYSTSIILWSLSCLPLLSNLNLSAALPHLHYQKFSSRVLCCSCSAIALRLVSKGQLHNNAVQPPLWFLDTPARNPFLEKSLRPGILLDQLPAVCRQWEMSSVLSLLC